MAVKEVTVFGAETKELDEKVKASAARAKKQLQDISKGASVAGGEVGGIAGKLKNLSQVGFAGLIGAGVGILIAGIQKATQMANEMFKGAIEDAQALNEDLQASMGRANKRIDSSEQALKVLTDAKKNGIGSEEEAERVRQAIERINREIGQTGVTIKKGADGQYTFDGSFSDYTETRIGEQLNDKAQMNVEAEIRSLQAIVQKNSDYASSLRDKWYNAGSFSAQKEARDVEMQNIKLSEQIIQLQTRLQDLKQERSNSAGNVSARAVDRKEREQAASDAQAAEADARRAMSAAQAARLQSEALLQGQKGPNAIAKAQAEAQAKAIAAQAEAQAKAAAKAVVDAEKARERAGNSASAKAAVDAAKAYEAQAKEAAKIAAQTAEKLAAAAKKEEIKTLQEDKKRLTEDANVLSPKSQIFTNDLTRRGGFQSGGMVWSTERFQTQQVQTARSILAQLRYISKHIDALQNI